MATRSSARGAKMGVAAGDWDYPGTVRFERVLAEENVAIAKLRANREDNGTGGAGQTRSRRNTGGQADKYQVKAFRGFGSEASDTEEKVQDTIGLALSGGGIRSAAFCLGALQALDLTSVLKKVDYLSTVSGGGYIGTCMTAAMQFNGGKFPFPSKLERKEPPSLQHIRDTSNYLFPNGPFDLFRNAAIYMRGLIANFIIVAAFLFLAAAVTMLANPTATALEKPFSGLGLGDIALTPFGAARAFAALASFSILLWGLFRSLLRVSKEIGEPEVGVFGWALILLIAIAFIELQPFVLNGLINTEVGKVVSGVTAYVTPLLGVFATVVGFLSRIIGEMVKHAFESPTRSSQLMGYLGTAMIWLAAAVVPLLLWVAYLALTYWGIMGGEIFAAPRWMIDLLALIGFSPENENVIPYLLIAVIMFATSAFLRPNANSLHPLYRDRLSKTFLFQPSNSLPDPDHDLPEAHLKLSELKEEASPYPIINSALNIQDSKIANRRGRNADFFMLTPKFIGSPTTRYVETKKIEALASEFDLGTAMAISGAAFSSSMGAATIKPLTPTLAILNIRLGYWLRNPIWVIKGGTRNIWANFYFLVEMLGLLNEKRKSVYLTDGGHVANLGVYELLRRRCHVIIAVDAEADGKMTFSSFVKLQQHARIDLGIRIEVPWHEINAVSLATGKAIDGERFDQQAGPHCAIGEIEYPGSQFGILIYIKASLSGDENDYIRRYRERYPRFPHETTFDQMFSEGQFEVYRALGFHASFGLFDRRDEFAYLNLYDYPRTSDEIAYLDQLFPQTSDPETRKPGQRTTFINGVHSQPAKKAAANT